MLAAGLEARLGVLLNLFNTHYWGHSVTFQAVSRWLRGESIPAQDKLVTLAEVLKIEPEVLRFGEAVRQSVEAARITNQAPLVLDCVRLFAAMLHQALAGRDKASILKPGSELLDIESLKAPVRTVLEGAYLRNACPLYTSPSPRDP